MKRPRLPREEAVEKALAAAGAALMAAFCLLPFGYMALVATAARPDFLAPGIDYAFTWHHFKAALTLPSLHVLDYLRNSLAVSGIAALSVPLLGALAAFPLARMALPGRGPILFLALSLSMFPPISLAGHLHRMMSSLGWINTLAALALPYAAWLLPFSVWFLVGYLRQVPPELDKAAAVDGCGPFRLLRQVLLPLAAPGVFSAALLAFVFAFNEFLFALLLTTDHRARTVPVGIALFQGVHGEIPWGLTMAVSVLSALPMVILALAFQRRIVQGLTRGAVKG